MAVPTATYDRSRGDLTIDLIDIQRKLEQLQPGEQPRDPRPLIHELLETSLPEIERDLKEMQKNLEASPPPAATPGQAAPTIPAAAQAIMAGMQKYTENSRPHSCHLRTSARSGTAFKGDPTARAAPEARDLATTGAQATAFETGLPSARVVRLSHANHYVFLSNEADVLREMNAFIASLPSTQQ